MVTLKFREVVWPGNITYRRLSSFSHVSSSSTYRTISVVRGRKHGSSQTQIPSNFFISTFKFILNPSSLVSRREADSIPCSSKFSPYAQGILFNPKSYFSSTENTLKSFSLKSIIVMNHLKNIFFYFSVGVWTLDFMIGKKALSKSYILSPKSLIPLLKFCAKSC